MVGITGTLRSYVFVGCVLFVFVFNQIKFWWEMSMSAVMRRVIAFLTSGRLRPYIFVGCILLIFPLHQLQLRWNKLRIWWKVGKFIVVERVITLLTRSVDVLMLYFIWTESYWGMVQAFIFATPVYLIFCATIVWLMDYIYKKWGYDLTGLEELREMAHARYAKRQWIKRAAALVLQSRRSIFWIGSWFYLDPDYVTLLLRDRNASFWFTFWHITVPSVLLSMAVWTFVWRFAYEGYGWALFINEWLP